MNGADPRERDRDREWELVSEAIARLRSRVMAVVFGAVGGFSLFVLTLWLVIRGGPNLGEHLSLLRHYFPGYTVSVGGAFLGLGYGALVGAAAGWTVAWVYNRVAERRNPQ